MTAHGGLALSEEVKSAIDRGTPVLAMESTIISHGMPYPRNVQTALDACSRVRERGVVPAITAIINGRIQAGLTDDEVDLLGRTDDVRKVSRRDLAFVVSRSLPAQRRSVRR